MCGGFRLGTSTHTINSATPCSRWGRVALRVLAAHVAPSRADAIGNLAAASVWKNGRCVTRPFVWWVLMVRAWVLVIGVRVLAICVRVLVISARVLVISTRVLVVSARVLPVCPVALDRKVLPLCVLKIRVHLPTGENGNGGGVA